jgi:hypothetical protein
MRACLRAEKALFMERIIFVILAIVVIANASGCATVCNPQSPGAAIGTGTPIGLAVGLAQFGACSTYFIAKKVLADEEKPFGADETKPYKQFGTQTSVNDVYIPTNKATVQPLDATYAAAVIEGEKYAAEGKAYAAAETAAEAAKNAQPTPVAVVAVPVAIVAEVVEPVTPPATK